jgi:hypothetical protein
MEFQKGTALVSFLQDVTSGDRAAVARPDCQLRTGPECDNPDFRKIPPNLSPYMKSIYGEKWPKNAKGAFKKLQS